MYNTAPHGIGLINPVDPSGQGRYKDEPFFVIGGATSVGQFGPFLSVIPPSIFLPKF